MGRATVFVTLCQVYYRPAADGRLGQNWRLAGAMLTIFVRNLALSVVKKLETVRIAASAHLARGRGNVDSIRDELIKTNRERVAQCARD